MKALILHGGWEGHTPMQTAEVFRKALTDKGMEVELSSTCECLEDKARLSATDLIVVHWTMGEISPKQFCNLSAAVKSGVGLAGTHGSADAFRDCIEFGMMIGARVGGHPHIGQFEVRLTDCPHEITSGMGPGWTYNSEQYYLMTDPGIRVLADTPYEYDGRQIAMPVVWTKQWGKGRVFYSALGHEAKEYEAYPNVLDMTIRGMLWASRGYGAYAPWCDKCNLLTTQIQRNYREQQNAAAG